MIFILVFKFFFNFSFWSFVTNEVGPTSGYFMALSVQFRIVLCCIFFVLFLWKEKSLSMYVCL